MTKRASGNGRRASLRPRIISNDDEDEYIDRRKPTKTEDAVRIWERNYASVSYVVYAIVALYAIAYLGYIFRVQSDRKLLLNYLPVKEYMGYNSYSLLTPLLSIILAIVLGYITKTRWRLSDGDYFGIVGIILFLSCLTLHDAVGIQRLHIDTTKVLAESSGSIEWIVWEKAWSTRPICLKTIEVKHHTDDPIPSDAIIHPVHEILPFSIFHSNDSFTVTPAPGSEEENLIKLINNTHDDLNCSGVHSAIPVSRPRVWMQSMQIDLNCCGPYKNVERWKKLVIDTKCDTGVNKSCGEPFIEYINDIFSSTSVIMFVETGLLLVTILLYTVHFGVMKKEKVTVTKAYSLLRITSQTVLHGYQDIHKEHHLQTQHYHQHLHYSGHPQYHRHVKRRRIQSIVTEHMEIVERPHLEHFVEFTDLEEEHKELETMFLSRSASNYKRPVFPRADSLEEPLNRETSRRVHPVHRRQANSFTRTRNQNTSVAETRLKAQIRASKAIALAAAAAADSDSQSESSTIAANERQNREVSPSQRHKKNNKPVSHLYKQQ